jgi:hypothetical protein
MESKNLPNGHDTGVHAPFTRPAELHSSTTEMIKHFIVIRGRLAACFYLPLPPSSLLSKNGVNLCSGRRLVTCYGRRASQLDQQKETWTKKQNVVVLEFRWWLVSQCEACLFSNSSYVAFYRRLIPCTVHERLGAMPHIRVLLLLLFRGDGLPQGRCPGSTCLVPTDVTDIV